jgi:uncharacterized repeat protein (TIGR03803 family)
MKRSKSRWLSFAFSLVALAIISLPADGQPFGVSEKILWSFGNGTDGAAPWAGVIRDRWGNLYGTTNGGGTYGVGTVFELTPDGTESVLWSFGNGTDGQRPHAGLIMDKSGNLYGTTAHGGAYGGGTVFELTPPSSNGSAWTESILWSFGNGTDGIDPEAGLIMDKSGNLYGTTSIGGANGASASAGGGIVFELTPPSSSGGTWSESILWNFAAATNGPASPNPNPQDGTTPEAGLLMDKSGNLYGTTAYGGTYGTFVFEPDNPFPPPTGGGTVFELTPPAASGGTWTESILWNFGNGTDGNVPRAGLIMDRSGNLYSTTVAGGIYGVQNSAMPPAGDGTIFKLMPPSTSGGSWTESILWNFGNDSDGLAPNASLIMDRSGNLYGITPAGGANAGGTVFKLTPQGTESVLWSFGSDSDGKGPSGGLLLGPRDNLYGTTVTGGAYPGPFGDGSGTVFEISQPFHHRHHR